MASIKLEDIADCPIRNVLDCLAGKWPLLVIHQLDTQGQLHFGELRRCIPDASPKMLSQTLKLLVTNQIVERQVIPDTPPRTLYLLTDYGQSLLLALTPLIQWASAHLIRMRE